MSSFNRLLIFDNQKVMVFILVFRSFRFRFTCKSRLEKNKKQIKTTVFYAFISVLRSLPII
jgi:hypothetical protein